MVEEKRKNKIVGLTVGIVLVVVVAVLVVALVGRGSSIMTVAQLRDAIIGKKALNCTITFAEGNTMVVQTTEGLKKVIVIMEEAELKLFTLMIEGEGTFVWDEAKTMAFKTDDMSELDGFVESMDEILDDEEEKDGVECISSSKANFDVPDDLEFMDINNVNSDDYDDWYYDEEGDDYSE